MHRSLVDTWGRLPAVTLPLPTTSRDTLGSLAAAGRDVTGTYRALDGARWSLWGAARDGARVTLRRRQIATGLALLALIALAVLFLPHELAVVAIAVVTTAYLCAGTYKLWLLLRGERALTAEHAALPAPPADDELPLYTALVPLPHEGKLLPVLIEQAAP